MRRPFLSRSLAIALTAAALLLGSLSIAGSVSAATKVAPTTTCANGMDNSGGLGLICQVTIVNTSPPRVQHRGPRSASVTARPVTRRPRAQTHGLEHEPRRSRSSTSATTRSMAAAGRSAAASRSPTTSSGAAPARRPSTKNQCVGSGDGIANECDPFPASTTNATITQCNGSANGGTLVQLKCTATGTKSSAASVRVNQCNGSANGGGALVICSANISNHRITAAAAASSGSSSGSTPTAPADRRRGRDGRRTDQPDPVFFLRCDRPPGPRIRRPTAVEDRHPLTSIRFGRQLVRLGDDCRPFSVRQKVR